MTHGLSGLVLAYAAVEIPMVVTLLRRAADFGKVLASAAVAVPLVAAAGLANAAVMPLIHGLGVTSGSFWMSFGTFAKMVDVWFTMGKAVLFAAMVAIISCLRGMEAKGGPRGVADAVNSSVVLNVVCIAIANLAVTQLQVMFFPMEIS